MWGNLAQLDRLITILRTADAATPQAQTAADHHALAAHLDTQTPDIEAGTTTGTPEPARAAQLRAAAVLDAPLDA